MKTRSLQHIIPAIATSDGGGVRLRRSLGQNQNLRVDPFLMLDEFASNNPDDYLAGFPSHPHRGFETVTYLLDGVMLHQDHLGNSGNLQCGGAQWMTAGRGIIHSEMPQQQNGRLHGFQLWINLPAREKMQPARYQDIAPEQIPSLSFPDGGEIKLLAGRLEHHNKTVTGPVQTETTRILVLDVRLAAYGKFSQPLNPEHNVFIYPYYGELEIGPAAQLRTLASQSAGVLSDGEQIEISTGKHTAGFLLLAGQPLREPVVQYGPFVMNTQAEIEQTLNDYRNWQLV